MLLAIDGVLVNQIPFIFDYSNSVFQKFISTFDKSRVYGLKVGQEEVHLVISYQEPNKITITMELMVI